MDGLSSHRFVVAVEQNHMERREVHVSILGIDRWSRAFEVGILLELHVALTATEILIDILVGTEDMGHPVHEVGTGRQSSSADTRIERQLVGG